MAFATNQRYTYQEPLAGPNPPFFELKAVEVATSCSTNTSHRSDHYTIFYMEEGTGDYWVDFNAFQINGAGIFFLSPGQVLTVEAESMKKGFEISFDREFYCVETHGKEIACNGVLFNNMHRATFIPLDINELGIFQQLIQQMINELEKPGQAHRDMLDAYLRMFLIEALRRNDNKAKPSTDERDDPNRLVGEFIALVDKHFHKVHAVADYAEMLHVSPKSIAKRLNATGYKTPTEIIRDRIVLEAKRDLRFTQKSVKEIAFDLGFDDPAYFTRYFKKSANESPQAYRATHLE